MNFFKSSQGTDGHYHIVYFNDESKTAALSFDDDHTHQYIWQPPQPGQFDEMGNQISPDIPGQWIMTPGPDGHLHDIEQYDEVRSQSREPESQVVRDVLELLQTSHEDESDSVKKGKESVDFVLGEQWDERDKGALYDADRAALTINLIGPKVDELCGYQSQQRQDLRYSPQEGGDQAVADILNVVSKKILENCFWEREESDIFWNQVVPGRGVINVGVSMDNDPRGEIYSESFPWDQIHFGPHEKSDLSDCEYLVKHRMYSKSKIEQLWPDKADKIQADFQLLCDEPSKHTTYQWDQYAHSDNKLPGSPISLGDLPIVDIAKKQYRVIECWRRIYEPVNVLAFTQDDVYFAAKSWRKKDVEAVRTIPGAAVIKRNSSRIRISKIAGGILLSDENPADLPVDDFFTFPVYGLRKNGQFQGKVERAKDPQREVNKRHSQSIDIGNKMCAYGWFYDQMTFNDRGQEEFKKVSTSPGFVQEIADVNRPPHMVEGTKFPSELVQLMELDRQFVDQLMMVNVPPNGANESGSMFASRQKLALQGSEYLFDNLSFAKKKLGRLLVACIQRYWDAPRIMHLLGNANQKQPVMIAGQPFDAYPPEDIEKMLNNADLTKYDVTITESAYSPTQRMSTLMLLRDFAQAGVQIPPELFPEFMDAPEEVKQRILAAIQAQQDAANAQQNTTQNAEVTKTLIGQGIIPPSVAQEYGVAPQTQGMPQGQSPQEPGSLAGPQPSADQVNPAQDKMEMLSAISEIVSAIKSTPVQMPPVNVNFGSNEPHPAPVVNVIPEHKPPRRRVGKITKLPNGEAAIEIQDIPDEVMANG